MNSSNFASRLALSLVALTAAHHVSHGQIIEPTFVGDYSFVDLGSAPGVLTSYGGLTFLAGDPNTLLLGGGANGGSGAIYSVGLVRDIDNHITGFSGAASLFASAPFIDGGLAYGPGGVLFYTTFNNNTIGQIKPGSTGPDKVIDLNPLSVASSTGSLQFVAPGFPDAGGLRILSYNGGGFYSGILTPDGLGTYDLSGITLETTTGFGPEGIIYVPSGSPVFTGPTALISEFDANTVAAYDLDVDGIPIPATRQPFITGLSGTEGAILDPLTGDFLFSTFGGGNRVIAIRGFAVAIPEAGTALLLALGALCAGTARRRTSIR